RGWYTTSSSAVKSVITGDFAKYYEGKTTAHAAGVSTMTGQAQRDIRDAGYTEIARVNKSISNQVNEYTAQINTAQEAITSNMPAEYDAVVNATNASKESAIFAIGTTNKKDLTDAIRNHKNTYLNRLDEPVAKKQSEAVLALNNEITSTKNELNLLLAQEQATANTEIQLFLDNKIAALEVELKILTDKGVAAAEAEIAAKGAKLLDNSLSVLDEIVVGIE
ncbi:MAG: hypothetical protein H7X86_11505, partial [Gorillibacterium sp.]|nr:hypothetical protein [Gorillibacterium sp.]